MRRAFKVSLLILAVLSTSCWDSHTNFDFDNTPPSTLGDGRYQYGATIDGRMTWWNVAFADVERTPDWTPGTEPPLSVTTALELAQRDVAKYTNTPAAYRLERVEWLHIGNHMTNKNKWIYLVTFERDYTFEGRTFSRRGTITIPVLLDGTVVQGKPQKSAA